MLTGVTLSGSEAGNYTVSSTLTTTANITPATLCHRTRRADGNELCLRAKCVERKSADDCRDAVDPNRRRSGDEGKEPDPTGFESGEQGG